MPNRDSQDRFLELLDEHRKILFKISATYGQSPADREDLVQEIVLQLWRSFGRYDNRQRFTTWMYRVALNVAISFRRGESRRPRAVVLPDEAILQDASAPTNPEESRDELRRLDEFIARLDPLDRALVLLYLDGNPHETIAEILGISATNVGTKIGRIKQKLRSMFAEHSREDN